MTDVVVIGAGQAGAALAAKLRALGHAGRITLLGAEPAPPYQRPPLSKGYLMGEMGMERLFLRPAEFYAQHDITLRTGATVTAIDRAARRVMVEGESLPYDHLVLTTGATPRRLPAAIGGDLAGVFTLRNLADVDAMRDAFRPGHRLLVVGGGYIGLEAAAVARKLGLTVTLVEAAPRILGRVASAETAAAIRALHQGHGVDLIEGMGLARLTGARGHVTGADLADGRHIAADVVLVGIGVTPDIALAEAAGLTIDNGIATDAQGRSSDPAIWSAGDCASFPAPGGRLRLESVQNAIDMAECVAANILGAGLTYAPVPWFWSDQYDVKLQIAGLNTGYTRVIARQGEGHTASFWYFADDRFIAVDAMNDPRAYMVGKRLLESGRSPDPAVLADPAADLRALIR
jgi:3-phenylpropionate/trans-cinnamate dioxygenase ferredoxin reductase component